MRRLVLSIAMSIVNLAMGAALAETNVQPGKQEIPLKEIWAFRMPETQDIRELEPSPGSKSWKKLSAEEQKKRYPGLLWPAIANSLVEATAGPHEGQLTRAGFAVAGNGLTALRNAHAVLVDRKKPRESFPAGSEVTVVFFHSHPRDTTPTSGKSTDRKMRFRFNIGLIHTWKRISR